VEEPTDMHHAAVGQDSAPREAVATFGVGVR
jgi:hypothetical protein